ncbi:hypothetical protein NL676_010587 [Syzygium grande]|nr:hypothetical protein NL676_010587 [Syzygium grande]
MSLEALKRSVPLPRTSWTAVDEDRGRAEADANGERGEARGSRQVVGVGNAGPLVKQLEATRNWVRPDSWRKAAADLCSWKTPKNMWRMSRWWTQVGAQ